MKIFIPEKLIELAERLKKYGTLYIVGGYVRNAILGFSDTDIDLAAGITPEKIVEVLKDSDFEIIEKSYKLGTVTIKCEDQIWEYTTFRKDNYASGGYHRPKSVDFIEDLRQDAQRRDFTMNSIYYDILKNEIIDIYSGVLDIKNRTVRCVETPSYVFAHDGLRILRMIRFACELNFKIDHSTFIAAKKMAHQINFISGFRKYLELTSILNSSKRYSISKKDAHIAGLNYYNELRLWNSHFVPTSKVRLNMSKKVGPDNAFLGLLIDIVDTVNPPCIEYFINDLLGQKGFQLIPDNVKYYNMVVCGYYDALNKLNNKKYFYKYFNYFNKIGEILPLKSKLLYAKYKFFYDYIIKHKLPISLKELNISKADLKKNLPNLSPKKYETVLYNALIKVFDGFIKNEKNAILEEIKNDVRNDNNN
jgi:tRNA nucleotidyltransferase/poly(A) polymerase